MHAPSVIQAEQGALSYSSPPAQHSTDHTGEPGLKVPHDWQLATPEAHWPSKSASCNLCAPKHVFRLCCGGGLCRGAMPDAMNTICHLFSDCAFHMPPDEPHHCQSSHVWPCQLLAHMPAAHCKAHNLLQPACCCYLGTLLTSTHPSASAPPAPSPAPPAAPPPPRCAPSVCAPAATARATAAGTARPRTGPATSRQGCQAWAQVLRGMAGLISLPGCIIMREQRA